MRTIVATGSGIALCLALGGCVGTVASVVTAPVRVAGKAVDMATTSQSEADEKRGRDLRRREARYGKLEREYRRAGADCQRGDDDACEQAEEIRAEMDDLRMTIPVERD